LRAAGQPGDLDNVALSTLTLVADTRKLYRIRFVDLPQGYYLAYFAALKNALIYDTAMTSHLDVVESPEQPAVMADFLLRYEHADSVLVTAIHGHDLLLSLRHTPGFRLAAGAVMTRLVRHLGEGGGHPTKAGGSIPLADDSPKTLENLRYTLTRRYLSALSIRGIKPQRLIPASA
jgi:hypothetical protein